MKVTCDVEVNVTLPVLSSRMVVEVIARLIELKKLNLLREAMNTFVDVPESALVDVLTFYLDQPNMDYEGLCSIPHMPMEYDPQEEDGDSKCLFHIFSYFYRYYCYY